MNRRGFFATVAGLWACATGHRTDGVTDEQRRQLAAFRARLRICGDELGMILRFVYGGRKSCTFRQRPGQSTVAELFWKHDNGRFCVASFDIDRELFSWDSDTLYRQAVRRVVIDIGRIDPGWLFRPLS